MPWQRDVVRRIEAVTEGPRGVTEQDRRLALPAPTVGRVESVDVEAATVAVGRRAARGRAKTVHRLPSVGEPAEDLLRLVVERLRPVDVELDRGERPVPVRDVEVPRAL